MSDNALDAQPQTIGDGLESSTAKPETQPTPPPQSVTDLPEWAQSMIRELRAEAAENRVKAKQAKETELAKLGEWEQLAKQRETELNAAQMELHQTRLEAAVIANASKLGFIDPAEAVALVDRGIVKIENGTVSGADEAVKKLAEAKPHLLKSPQTTAPKLPDHNPSGESKPDLSWHPFNQNRNLFGGG